MSLTANLVAFALRQVVGDSVENLVQWVENYLSNHSQALPKALARANDRAWQALGIALAGDGFLDQVKVFFASGDDKGIREQVARFLSGNPLGLESKSEAFRRACLGELKQLRKAKRLSLDDLNVAVVARQAATFQRHTNPASLIQGAILATTQVADAIRDWAPNLARLLRQPTPAGPPLLAAAFCYFFRREVETDDELAHGLFFDGLRQLSASQAKAFGDVRQALDSLGGRFDEVFEQLGRIEVIASETQVAVLDLQVEFQRFKSAHSAGMDEVRRLIQNVHDFMIHMSIPSCAVQPHPSSSIHGRTTTKAEVRGQSGIRRLPVYLLIDTSISMAGEPIEACRQGLRALLADFLSNPQALETVWISIITFGSCARQIVPLTDVCQFQEPELHVDTQPGVDLAGAMRCYLDAVEREFVQTAPGRKGDWMPLSLVMVSQASTTPLAAYAKILSVARKWILPPLIVACGPGADVNQLRTLSDQVIAGADITPESFHSFFKWVSPPIVG